MGVWSYCPNCGVRTDNEKRENGKYYCTCGAYNPNIRVRQETKHGKQAKIATQTVRGKEEVYQ